MDEDTPRAALLDDLAPQTLARNVARVLADLNANRYGDNPPAKLIAVTKTVTPTIINQLPGLGILDIAENRAQVALPKLPLLRPDFNLHWIGRLQTNKVKDIIGMTCMIHSLDRLPLVQEIERRAANRGIVMPALVQVNIAREEQKAGLDVTEVRPFLRQMKDFANIRVVGLMSIMPLTPDEARLTELFRGMRTLFEQLRDEAIDGVRMEELSMGMSHDYAIAAREGATMVRVGSALYRAD